MKIYNLYFLLQRNTNCCKIRVEVEDMDIMDEDYAVKMDAIRRYSLMDDFYMTEFFKDNIPAVQLVLRIILDNDDIIVEKVSTQSTVPNLHGRSVRLDVFAKDSTGKRYNIEVQCEDKGASVRRARYNGSLLDAGVTNPGDGYEDLPDVYVIFITRHDVLGKGLPIYHIDRMIEETKEKVEDGSHIIYVTSDYAAETPLGMLMADFNNPDPHTMNYGILKDKAVCLKETEEGAEQIMCKISEELVEYGMKKGMEKEFEKAMDYIVDN